MARYAVCRCEVIVKCQHCVSQPSLLLISLSFAMAQVAVDQMLRSVLCDAPSIHETPNSVLLPAPPSPFQTTIQASFPSQVIFSQASELLERQSSMASSTECVSGPGNDVSTEQSKHDTTDTEQRFGMYMRDFDFLEYELESLEGESVDNFNWGVSVRKNELSINTDMIV